MGVEMGGALGREGAGGLAARSQVGSAWGGGGVMEEECCQLALMGLINASVGRRVVDWLTMC